MSTRKSDRILGSQSSKLKKSVDAVKYFAGQGLAIAAGSSFSLAVCLDDVNIDEPHFQVTRLRPGTTANKYEEGDEARLTEADVLSEIEIVKSGKSYKVTRKQLQDLRKDLGMTVEKAPKVGSKRTKKAAAPKKGKLNLSVPIVRECEVKDSPSSEPILNFSICYNDRNLHRAARTGNLKLLRKLSSINGCISTYTPYWNPDNYTTPLDIAVKNGDFKFIKEFLVLYQKKYDFAQIDQGTINRVNTGSVSVAAYGVRVRSVNMSRGGREGNNAFLADLYMGSSYLSSFQQLFDRVWQWVTPKMFDFFRAHLHANHLDSTNSLGFAVRAGNLDLAKHIMAERVANGGYGFNQLHLEVLGDAPLTPFKKVSVTKKPNESFSIAPLHCAAINPDSKQLESLLSMCDDINYPDTEQRKAIHYAAACVSGSTAKLLLDSGANVNDGDRFKNTPLMIAAQFNRAEAAEVLLKAGAVATAKNRQGNSAICIAAQYNSLDVLRLLLDSGVDIESTGINKRTPLICAAMMGNFEVVQELLDRGAKVLKRDKLRKSALLYAAKNGEMPVASLLLHYGADPNDPDSSKNYPLHYAASGCWPECIDLLLSAGADINCQNDWKLTPLLIALLKGHSGIVNMLLTKPGIDVNCKDESGRTILSQAVGILSEETLKQAELLLGTKGADPNVPDLEGKTALHHLSGCPKPICPYDDTKTKEQIEEWVVRSWTYQVEYCQLLLRYGANINMRDSLGSTPILNAVLSKNTELIHVLLREGADLYVKDLSGRNIFHLTAQFDSDMWEFVQQILSNQALVEKCLNQIDDEGYSPFLRAVKYFVTEQSQVYSQIDSEVREEFDDKQKPSKFKKATGSGKRKKLRTISPEFKSRSAKLLSRMALSKKAVPKPVALPYKKVVVKAIASPSSSVSSPSEFGQTPEKPASLSSVLPPTDEAVSLASIETIVRERFNEYVSQFITVLRLYIDAGSIPDAKVEKLKKYKDDPELISREYDESKNAPANPFHYGYQKPVEKKYFIDDLEGNRHWIEYNEDGLNTALHIASTVSNSAVIEFLVAQSRDLNSRNFYGKTALAIGAENNLASDTLELIIKAGADPNIVNYRGETPLLKAVEAKSLENSRLLIKSGALPDIQSVTGDSALLNAVNQKFLKLVEVLCEGGADPNLTDLKHRTSLHHAFNNAETSADASFDIEAVLLEHGANINARDIRNRTPLHYAFVKMGKPDDASFIDPIETVSSACGVPGLDANIQDNWGKTPLHYSAQHGSVTSAMFLMSKGADYEVQDSLGNTPLTLSYIYAHPNYAFMMIQKGSSVFLPVTVPPPAEPKKKERHYEDEDEDEDEQASQQFDVWGNPIQQYDMWGNPIQSKRKAKLKEGSYSQFHAAVVHEWQGVAYLLLFNGFDYMLAMQDAMNEHKFQLVLTLLAKVQDNTVVQQCNSKGQNLYHILAMFGANANYELTTAIGEKLLKRKVPLDLQDEEGRTPLHYAAQSHYSFLVHFLSDHGCFVDSLDKSGATPLELAIRGKNVTGAYDIVKMLQSRGARYNLMITEGELKLTPLIHSIMQSAHIDLIKLFIRDREGLNLTDSRGRTPLMHAIRSNNAEVIETLLATEEVDLDVADAEGRTALHHVVVSSDFGSYENVEILDLIHQAGTDPKSLLKHNKKTQRSSKKSEDSQTINPRIHDRYTKADNSGHTPYWYAAHQQSGRMRSALEKLGITEAVDAEVPDSGYVSASAFDYIRDAQTYISQQQEITQVTEEPRKPDPVGNFEAYYQVIGDYDLLMTKIDIKFGPYGGYVFYRMQLLRDTNRDVFVLLTRWGRIGEIGMHQRTAFNDQASAENEFRKIYKQKSGNEWGSPFTPVKGKYKPQNINLRTVKHADFLKPLNFKAVKSQLEQTVAKTIKVVTNVKLYHLQFASFNINVNVLNFSNIPLGAIEDAEAILKEISGRVKQFSGKKTPDTDTLLRMKEEVMDLTSRFYELIPFTGYENRLIPPIGTEQQLKENFDILYTLKNIEAASKMLLGAKLREKTVNPLDYIVGCLQVRLEAVTPDSPEHQLLARYIVNGGHSLDKVAGIIRVDRSGEADRIKQWADTKNRKLLWHGSTNANFVGILSQGLKIAPKEAPSTGWMFGKGLYFADYMGKSLGYTESGSKHSFILLCEVVLGKTHNPETSFTSTKLPKNSLSTHALGTKGPDFSQSVFLQDGLEVPVGPVIQYENPNNEVRLVSHSEYIVYDVSQVRIRYLVHLKRQ